MVRLFSIKAVGIGTSILAALFTMVSVLQLATLLDVDIDLDFGKVNFKFCLQQSVKCMKPKKTLGGENLCIYITIAAE